jgi:prepilin-type N-terminal cleavage/methylation domain-containing protein
MHMNGSSRRKGFSLAELLVVLAVVGVITAVAFGSISLARTKARDNSRIADMKEIQLGLALYYDVNRTYPATLSILDDSDQKFLPAIPVDPKTRAQYEYLPYNSNRNYCIGVTLEDTEFIPNDSTTNAACNGLTSNYKASR